MGEKGRRQARYEYKVVTSNGCGVHSTHKRCSDAKVAAARAVARCPSSGPYEIERAQLLEGGGRRYWMRKRARWVLWHPKEGIESRRPDWIWGRIDV